MWNQYLLITYNTDPTIIIIPTTKLVTNYVGSVLIIIICLLLLVDIILSIDYEYASMNFLPYDIGNHFCEYAGKQPLSWMLYEN